MLRSTNFWIIFFSGVVVAGVVYLLLFSETTGGSAGRGSPGAIADVRARLAKYAVVDIQPDLSGLSVREKEMLKLLIEAGRVADDVFWKQASHKGLSLRKQLSESSNPEDKVYLEFLNINYGPYDRLDDNKPFYIDTPKPPGAGFYPSDLTRQEFEKFLQENPAKKKDLVSEYTVVQWENGDKLKAVPYSKAYAEENTRICNLLKQAAEKTDNQSFKMYLEAKVEDFLKDDFYNSDTLWLKVKDSKLDLVIGPTEVYEDSLFNYKAAYEAFVLIKDEEASKKLEIYNEQRNALEGRLPVPETYRKQYQGVSSPLAVAQLVYTGGDSNAGSKTIAFNLPNSERVREETGSKKVLLKNVIEAKFTKILLPIADVLLISEIKKNLTVEAFSTNVLMHEYSHSFGLNYTIKDPKLTVRNALGHYYSTIEECKADVVGLYNQSYFFEKGLIEKRQLEDYYATFVASLFRSIRFGATEAHGTANLIQFNYLFETGAILFDQKSGKYNVNFDKVGEGIRQLSKMVLTIQGDGDKEAAEKLINRYGKMNPDLEKNLALLKDLPVDVVFNFKTEL